MDFFESLRYSAIVELRRGAEHANQLQTEINSQ